MAEGQKCIFCAIIDNKVQAKTIYEDENFLAFLDIRPRNPGHSLVVPKIHYQWVYDVPNFGTYWEVAKQVALATKKALNAEFISFITLGTEVSHAHIQIIPRFPDDGHGAVIDWNNIKQISEESMATIATKIRDAIPEFEEKKIEETEVKTEEPKRTAEEIEWIKRELERD